MHFLIDIRGFDPLEIALFSICMGIVNLFLEWSAHCRFKGLNLESKIQTGSFRLVNASSISPESPRDLKATYLDVKRLLETLPPEERSCVLIVDDLSSLEWIGLEPVEITRFIRAILALCRKVGPPDHSR